MLARLDQVPGVEESRVDWTGRYILLRLKADADDGRVTTEAASTLGDGATRLDRAAESQKLETYRSGEPWLRAGETLRLSREEARVLARRFAGKAAGDAELTDEESRRVAKILEEEFAAAFDRIHASGEKPDRRFRAEWSTVLERATVRTNAFLSKDRVARVAESLRQQLAR